MIAAIGWIGSALCVWSLIQKDPSRFRALNLGACVALIVFDSAIGAWSMVLLNVVVAGINIQNLRTLRRAARSTTPVTAAADVAAVATATVVDRCVDPFDDDDFSDTELERVLVGV
ncbi:MAG TPA: hypothetical protein VGM78_12690 [Ilumatobacteraceae bacterium]|jgi:hypothetical protein